MSQQFNRKIDLVVGSSATGRGINLGSVDGQPQLKFTFQTRSQDVDTPNNCVIRVYNLNNDTRKEIIQEFDTVLLQAGYQDNVGIIFSGQIKQFHRGRETNVNNFLDIMAADSDPQYNFSMVARSFPAGTTPQQMLSYYSQALDLSIDTNANKALKASIQPSVRGKVAFGMTRNYLREMARTNNARWSIQNGTVTLIPLDSYLPGQVVLLNASNGVVGVPIATNEGIEVTCLLNPRLKVGYSVQLDNSQITATIVKDLFFPQFAGSPTLVASTDNDGLYRILAMEHSGDTRDNEYYTKLTCIHIDQSNQEVPDFG